MTQETDQQRAILAKNRAFARVAALAAQARKAGDGASPALLQALAATQQDYKRALAEVRRVREGTG